MMALGAVIIRAEDEKKRLWISNKADSAYHIPMLRTRRLVQRLSYTNETK